MALADYVMRAWRIVPLHVQGACITLLPLVAILFSFSLALVGNYQRARIEAALERHVQMTRGLTAILTLMVDAETGMRGYLLTRRQDFLEPYALATQELPVTMTEISALVESEPGEQPRARKLVIVSSLHDAIDQQLDDLDWQRQYVSAGDPSADEIPQHLDLGKRLMDEIRDDIGAMQREEEQLLHERLQDINDIRTRDYFTVFVTLAIGFVARLLAWYLFRFGPIRRIEHLAANARSLEHGGPLPFPPSGKSDALGGLEQDIARLARTRPERSGDPS